ncbi:LysR family transcriptional regulator [Leucobacter komagatae]|uniref:LysR family transcriptional regulator n=2 Tax=Leucobacter komagatae TaxID=55969 RepID=A0A0D0IVD3_9MICO|nr:LysR family transcriptional regulator [Leucobacter komagatae]
MEMQQMRYVVAVAEERSFTRAAERCRVVQSALSHQVKALERELGVSLFARTSRRVELTPAGEAFLPAARASLAAAERAQVDAAAAAGEVRGALSIGLIPTVTAVDVPRALAEFHRAYPHVQIGLRGGGSDGFVSEIIAGRMDAAILGFPDDVRVTGVATRVLARERLVAVVPEGHPLAGPADAAGPAGVATLPRDGVRLADLAGETFADFPADTPGRAQSDRAFAAAGVRRDAAFEAMDVGLLLELVRNGLVVTIMARGLVAGQPGVRAVELADGPTRVEYLAWSAFNPSPAALAFLGFLERSDAAATPSPR